MLFHVYVRTNRGLQLHTERILTLRNLCLERVRRWRDDGQDLEQVMYVPALRKQAESHILKCDFLCHFKSLELSYALLQLNLGHIEAHCNDEGVRNPSKYCFVIVQIVQTAVVVIRDEELEAALIERGLRDQGILESIGTRLKIFLGWKQSYNVSQQYLWALLECATTLALLYVEILEMYRPWLVLHVISVRRSS